MASGRGLSESAIAEDPAPPGAMNSISAAGHEQNRHRSDDPAWHVPLRVVSLFCCQRDSLDRKGRTKFRTPVRLERRHTRTE